MRRYRHTLHDLELLAGTGDKEGYMLHEILLLSDQSRLLRLQEAPATAAACVRLHPANEDVCTESGDGG